MYARIAFFEGGGPEIAETARRLFKEQFLPEMKKMQGFAGTIQLADLEARRAAGIILFDSEESLRAGDEQLNSMSPPPEMGDTRRTGVEKYEVTINELGQEAGAARLSRLRGPADKIDETVRFAEESILPAVRLIEGARGVLGLADRKSGDVTIITFWENAEAMRASEQEADRLRSQTAEKSGGTITGVERYDAVLMEVPVGALRR
jgi:heme-degrading monooxygenase HmoA